MSEPEPKTSWQCQRCLWILTGREGDEIPEHAPPCPFRNTGEDPVPEELHIGNRGN